MEQSRRKNSFKYLPPHYINLMDGELVAGNSAVEAFLKEYPEGNLHTLGTLLREPVGVIDTERCPRRDISEWDKTRFIQYGRWLSKVVDPPVKLGEKLLNQGVINQAFYLGIGPSEKVISSKKRFGTLSNYYRELGITNTHRVGNFENWSTEKLIQYLKNVGEELGGIPTRSDIAERAKRNPQLPSEHLIYGRFGEKGWSKALELAGYFVPENMTRDDYIEWGVKFALANDGLIPVARHLRILSKKQVGPSDRVTGTKFGSLIVFQHTVAETYKERVEDLRSTKEYKLSSIEDGLTSGSLPRELFSYAITEDEMISAYAKYLVLNALCPEKSKESKVIISTIGYQGTNFIHSIRRSNNAITAGHIESEALFLGVFDDIWPGDKSYMDTLKLTPYEVTTAGGRRDKQPSERSDTERVAA